MEWHEEVRAAGIEVEALKALLNKLDEAGWAYVLFTPNELKGVDPYDVSDAMVQRGWDLIDAGGY